MPQDTCRSGPWGPCEPGLQPRLPDVWPRGPCRPGPLVPGFLRRYSLRDVLQEVAGPRDEILPVRPICVTAIMLSPREVTVHQADVDRWHLLLGVVLRGAEVFLGAEKAKHRTCGHTGHEAALLIEPL